jgi:hypothetical protein
VSEGQAKEARVREPAEIMDDTSGQWLQQAAQMEEHADDLRRQELALRADIVGLRKAAYGIRNAIDQRAEAVERNDLTFRAEREQLEDSSEPDMGTTVAPKRMSSSYKH